MGDISELRGLLVVITFLGVAVILITAIPSQFYAGAENRDVTVPDLFESMDVYNYAETKTVQTNESGGYIKALIPSLYQTNIDIGGHDIDLIYRRANYTDKIMYVNHYYAMFWIHFTSHEFEWKNKNGQVVSETWGGLPNVITLAQLVIDEAGTGNARYRIKCPHGIQLDLGIAYNTTTYATLENAWDHGNLFVFFGINFDQVNTSYNALSIITAILFFQFPEDAPTYIKALLSIPIYVCVAYITFILVLRAIGAVFGGGGA